MTRMNNTMTIRLPRKDIEIVKQISIENKKDKSTIVRELIEQGKVYFAIKEYKDGKISIGKASEIAGLTISEMMDVLANLGIKNNIELEDYFEGYGSLKNMF
ncbi:UPF0175 family protein [Candidatus Woesearchaeota archaeon]|nr:UPF0175 family protein [Candidatus Woesearchaeota archaeon]